VIGWLLLIGLFLFAVFSLVTLGPTVFLAILGLTLLVEALGSIGSPRS
jgi:hypothetical protein